MKASNTTNGYFPKFVCLQKKFQTHNILFITAKSIREIQRNEVLPIILLPKINNTEFHAPKYIQKVEIKDGRIVKGSEFFSGNPRPQLFFCPKKNSNEKCLEPRTFGRLEPLQCTTEATPVVQQLSTGSNKCGINGSGTLYEVSYEVSFNLNFFTNVVTSLNPFSKILILNVFFYSFVPYNRLV